MSKGVSVKLTNVNQLKAALQKAGLLANHALAQAVYMEASNVMAASVAEAPVGAYGALRASHFVDRPKVTALGASVEFGYGGVAGAYALYVHEGVGPAVGQPAFFPPPDAFVDWVRRKGLPSDWGMTDEQAAFVVARSVGQKGFEGRKFLSDPLKKRATGMGNRMARRVSAFMKAV